MYQVLDCHCACHKPWCGQSPRCFCKCREQLIGISEAIKTTDAIFQSKEEKSKDITVNQQIFIETIQSNIANINRIINLYDSQHMQEAKTFLKHAEEMILKGLSANE
jgi:hypothetical protein